MRQILSLMPSKRKPTTYSTHRLALVQRQITQLLRGIIKSGKLRMGIVGKHRMISTLWLTLLLMGIVKLLRSKIKLTIYQTSNNMIIRLSFQ